MDSFFSPSRISIFTQIYRIERFSGWYARFDSGAHWWNGEDGVIYKNLGVTTSETGEIEPLFIQLRNADILRDISRVNPIRFVPVKTRFLLGIKYLLSIWTLLVMWWWLRLCFRPFIESILKIRSIGLLKKTQCLSWNTILFFLKFGNGMMKVDWY